MRTHNLSSEEIQHVKWGHNLSSEDTQACQVRTQQVKRGYTTCQVRIHNLSSEDSLSSEDTTCQVRTHNLSSEDTQHVKRGYTTCQLKIHNMSSEDTQPVKWGHTACQVRTQPVKRGHNLSSEDTACQVRTQPVTSLTSSPSYRSRSDVFKNRKKRHFGSKNRMQNLPNIITKGKAKLTFVKAVMNSQVPWRQFLKQLNEWQLCKFLSSSLSSEKKSANTRVETHSELSTCVSLLRAVRPREPRCVWQKATLQWEIKKTNNG